MNSNTLHCSSNITISRWLKIAFLLFALCYSFSFSLWVMYSDPFYWINCFDHFDEDRMQFLSLFIGKIVTTIFGKNVIVANILGWLFAIMSIFVFFLSIIPRKEWFDKINYLSIGIILMGGWTQNMYNPDSPTLLLTTVLAVLFIKCKNKSYIYIVASAIVTGLAVLCRFPNILFVLVFIPFIVYNNYIQKEKIISSILQTICYLFFVGVIIYCGYEFCIAKSIITVSNASVDQSHTPSSLIIRYIFGLRSVSCKILAIFGIVFLGFNFGNRKIVRVLYAIFLLFVLFQLHYAESEATSWKTTFGFCIISLIVFYIKDKKINELVDYIFIILIGFIPAAGSDTYLMKIFPFFAVVSPVVLSLYDTHFSANKIVKITLLCFIVFSVFYFSTEFAKRRVSTISRIPNVTMLVSSEKLHKLEDDISVINRYKSENNNIFFGGNQTHIYYLATNTITPYKTTFWQEPINEDEINTIVTLVNKETKYTIFNFEHSELLHNKLLEIGYIEVYKNSRMTVYRMISDKKN